MASVSKLSRHQARMGYFFITPTIVLFVIFTIIPVIMALYLSFTNYDIVSKNDFVGLVNYKRLVDDPTFWTTLKNVLFYSVLYIPLNIAISLSMAVLFMRKRFGVKLFRTAGYLPTLTSGVAAA